MMESEKKTQSLYLVVMRRKVDEYSNLEGTCQDSYSKTCLKEKMEYNIINHFY